MQHGIAQYIPELQSFFFPPGKVSDFERHLVGPRIDKAAGYF